MLRGWREILEDWIQRCPRCGERWLVSGAGEGDGHICKSCGEHFRVQRRRLKGRRHLRDSGGPQAEEVCN
jgi:tRNA(Ile2) C34 agmatinyltransferase TiaS